MSGNRKNLTSPNGDVRTLLLFRKAVIIYDLTFYFGNTFLARNDRTVDQMIQAARSGKQNIAEGSAASVTSMETAIKLTNVAKGVFWNCCWITKIFCGYAICGSGRKIPRKFGFCGRSQRFLRFLTNGLSIWRKLVLRKPSPIWRSSFCIRKIICCRSSLMRWSGSFCPAAGSGNSCFPQD